MDLNQKMKKLQELISRKQRKQQKHTVNIPDEDNIRLLAALYTFNHGNKVCLPFEYSCNAGCKENGGGDFLKFKQEVSNLGYRIEGIVIEDKLYRLKPNDDDFGEIEQKDHLYLPSKIEYFILSNSNGEEFKFRESPLTLELLANSGDERAKGTYDNWMIRTGNTNYMGQAYKSYTVEDAPTSTKKK